MPSLGNTQNLGKARGLEAGYACMLVCRATVFGMGARLTSAP